MRGENERKTEVYSMVNEDFERVFNKADRFLGGAATALVAQWIERSPPKG